MKVVQGIAIARREYIFTNCTIRSFQFSLVVFYCMEFRITISEISMFVSNRTLKKKHHINEKGLETMSYATS